jgi:hypothetical protein
MLTKFIDLGLNMGRGWCKNSDQNNAKGTGSASVFGFFTEAFFLCLRTAAEKNSFEDQVLQAAHGHREIRNILM